MNIGELFVVLGGQKRMYMFDSYGTFCGFCGYGNFLCCEYKLFLGSRKKLLV